MKYNKAKKYHAAVKNKPVSFGLFFAAFIALSVISTILLINIITYKANKLDLTADAVPQPNTNGVVRISNNDHNAKKQVSDKFGNVSIDGVDISGLTKEEALAKLNNTAQDEINQKRLFLVDGTAIYEYGFNELGAHFDFAPAVDFAYDYKRYHTKNSKKIKSITVNGQLEIDYENELIYDYNTLKNILKNIHEKSEIKPVEASYKKTGNSFVIQSEQTGRQLNIEKTIALIETQLLLFSSGEVGLVFDSIEPKFTMNDFYGSDILIGSFSTRYNQENLNRNTNIHVAANSINGTVVYPDEVFSTNKAFGAYTPENGYVNAPVIVSGTLTEDIGGGVCQVSSTLYNAVLYSELEVVERQNHSLKVSYLDYGYDATLAGDYIDFKFKNNSGHPIYIETIMDRGTLTVNIYGYETRSTNRCIKFVNLLVEVLDWDETIIEDPTLSVNQIIVDTEGKNGYKYSLYKIIYENNIEVKRELVNNSVYKAVKSKIRVGTLR